MRPAATAAVLACPASAGALASRMRAPASLRVARVVEDAADLLATLHAGLAVVVFVGAELPGLDSACVREARELEVAVVGVLPDDGDDDALSATRLRFCELGVTAVVRSSAHLAELRQRVDLAARTSTGEDEPGHPATEPHVDGAHGPGRAPAVTTWQEIAFEHLDGGVHAGGAVGRVIAVWGPTGAPGRSTLAAAMAAIIARNRSCLLLDVDPYGGAQAHLFDLPTEASGLTAAVHAAAHDRLDPALMNDLSVSVAANLRVLAGLPGAEGWPRLRPDGVRRVVDAARRAADVVVVDCGFCLEDDEELSYDTRAPRRNAATLTALEECDEVVVVGSADRIGLARLIAATPDLDAVLDPRVRRRVVLNRARPASFPDVASDPGHLGLAEPADLHLVPDEPAAFDAALVAGKAVPDVAAHGEASAALERLVRDLFGRPGGRPDV